MKYDLAVIGGGPAGMMAAGRAGELGERVILLEKNASLGTKLLATGNGRCNLTNMSADEKESIGRFGRNGKFLLSPFSKFGVAETLDFFEQRGVVTKVEDNSRVFPVSDRARDVLQALETYLSDGVVEVRYNAVVQEVEFIDNVITKIILMNGDDIVADRVIIAAGGQSYPLTGSTGDAYAWLKKMGHTIIEPRPILTPVVVRENFIKEVEGVSLKQVEINLKCNEKKIAKNIGSVLFTADGLSGPAVIDMSREIDLVISGKWTVTLDFVSEINEADLDLRLRNEFHRDGLKLIKNNLAQLIPARLAVLILKLLDINIEKQLNAITKGERIKIVQLLKRFTLEVVSVKGFDKAMVTAGGINLREVDSKTMASKLIKNLYFAGEILDLDGPTGGYNLQICWSTGFVAGNVDAGNVTSIRSFL